MIVILSEGVVDTASKTADVTKLHKLFGFAAEGRHILVAASRDEVSSWLKTLDSPTRSVYQQALQLSIRSSATLSTNTATVRITVADTPSNWDRFFATLNIADALSLLQEPLGILLENANNDWHFLRRIIRSSERVKLQRAIDSRWAEALHGGGSDLTQRITERAQVVTKRLRTFVLFDSDRRHPDELNPDWAPQAPEACQGFTTEKVVNQAAIGGYWRLSRRFIESYMPKQEMAQVAALKIETVDAFFRLSIQGQRHFNIKKGFKDDAKVENAHRAKDLYTDVSSQDKQLLHEGLGRKVADRYSVSEAIEFDWDHDARQEALRAVPHLMRLL
jgi:hypothetical protein